MLNIKGCASVSACPLPEVGSSTKYTGSPVNTTLGLAHSVQSLSGALPLPEVGTSPIFLPHMEHAGMLECNGLQDGCPRSDPQGDLVKDPM